ncbi:TonB-dependent receptor domain-containing protein [Pseudoruegeria sp. HB172150]|uniref:TonB-dependent receptor domain-containing protein n=1 Tax=Pseudoruegeria sp. HB172150 TaxID=2721164 RepID=UPI001551A972|nr:TonB-dependent receptor [Pseudoruegeria sp. HB172150]
MIAATVVPMEAAAQDGEAFLGTIVLAAPAGPDPDGEILGIPDLADDVINISSAGIALSNPADLSELFVAEPTIAVGSSIPMSQKVYVNGIEENNLAISIDGARQNNKIFHHNTTTLIDPALLKVVRIDPGVAPADAGPGALGGALAYETKDAADLRGAGDTFGGRYKFEFDTNGNIVSNSLTLYGMQGGWDYLAFLKYADGNPRKDGDGVEIVGSGTGVFSGLAKLAYQSDTGSRIELSFEQVEDDEARPYRANIGQIIGGRPVPPTRPYEMTRTNVALTYTETAPDGLWDPRIQIAYSGTDLFIDESDLSTAQTVEGVTESISGVFSNRFDLGWGSINAGVDFFSDTAETDYVYLPNSAWNEAAKEKLRNFGVFAQARLEPTVDTRLSFGARADFQEFTGVDGSTQSASGVSGNVSGEWDVTDRFTVSAGYAHVWGGIELAENFIMNPAWSYADSGIESVTAQNYYVAAAYDFGNWIVDGKIFGTDINNARAASYSGGPELTTDLQSRGYEVGFGYGWNGGFLRVGFASIDTELDGRTADSYTGNYLTMPMGDFLTVQAAHEFNNGVLVGGDAQIAFDYDDTYDYDTGGQGPTLPGYTVVNIFTEYTPPQMQNLTFRAEVNNLFDETYASRATYGQEFVGEVVPLNEPGRSIRLSAEIAF